MTPAEVAAIFASAAVDRDSVASLDERARRVEALNSIRVALLDDADADGLIAQKVGDGLRDASWRIPCGESGLLSLFVHRLVAGVTGAARVQALRVVGNACADTDENRFRVLAHDGAVRALVGLLRLPATGDDDAVLAYAVPVLFNLCTDYEPAQRALAADAGATGALAALLARPPSRRPHLALPTTLALLQLAAAQEAEEQLARWEELGGAVERLLSVAVGEFEGEEEEGNEDDGQDLSRADFCNVSRIALQLLATLGEAGEAKLLAQPQGLPRLLAAFDTFIVMFDKPVGPAPKAAIDGPRSIEAAITLAAEANIQEDDEDEDDDYAVSAAMVSTLRQQFIRAIASVSGRDDFPSLHPISSPAVQTLISWLAPPVASRRRFVALQTATCLALGNWARSDERTAQLMGTATTTTTAASADVSQKTGTPPQTRVHFAIMEGVLMYGVFRCDCPAQGHAGPCAPLDAHLLHAALSLLRQLAVPAAHRAEIARAGALGTLPRFWAADYFDPPTGDDLGGGVVVSVRPAPPPPQVKAQIRLAAVSLARLLLTACAPNVETAVSAGLDVDGGGTTLLAALAALWAETVAEAQLLTAAESEAADENDAPAAAAAGVDADLAKALEPITAEAARGVAAIFKVLYSGPRAAPAAHVGVSDDATAEGAVASSEAAVSAAETPTIYRPGFRSWLFTKRLPTIPVAPPLAWLLSQRRFAVLRSEALFLLGLMASADADGAGVAAAVLEVSGALPAVVGALLGRDVDLPAEDIAVADAAGADAVAGALTAVVLAAQKEEAVVVGGEERGGFQKGYSAADRDNAFSLVASLADKSANEAAALGGMAPATRKLLDEIVGRAGELGLVRLVDEVQLEE